MEGVSHLLAESLARRCHRTINEATGCEETVSFDLHVDRFAFCCEDARAVQSRPASRSALA